jgi:hypothetical protein
MSWETLVMKSLQEIVLKRLNWIMPENWQGYIENSDMDANRDREDTDLVQEHCSSHVSELPIYW